MKYWQCAPWPSFEGPRCWKTSARTLALFQMRVHWQPPSEESQWKSCWGARGRTGSGGLKTPCNWSLSEASENKVSYRRKCHAAPCMTWPQNRRSHFLPINCSESGTQKTTSMTFTRSRFGPLAFVALYLPNFVSASLFAPDGWSAITLWVCKVITEK